MYRKFLISLILVCLITATAFSQSVTLDHVDGLTMDGYLDLDVPIVFHLRLTSGAENYDGITNGFTISSPDASWGTTLADTVYPMKTLFDGIFSINTFSTDGSGADTVGFGGTKFFGLGMGPSFDEVTYSITIGPLSSTEQGKIITLDSAFYPPTGTWKWAGPVAFPSWDGPHAFTVLPGDPPPYALAVAPDSFYFEQFVLIDDDTTHQGSFAVTQTENEDAIDFTATSMTSWLSIVSSDGTTPGDVVFETSKPGDTAGVYIGYIEVSSEQALNSPQTVQIIIELIDPPKYLVIDPTELNFTAIEGHANPASQLINVTELNNFNIDFEAVTNALWISINDPVGTTPDDVTVQINIDGFAPGNYVDTVTFLYDEDPQDGTRFYTLINLEVTENNLPVIAPITNYSIDECGSINALFSASDQDGDALDLWLDPLFDNMSFVDNGNNTGMFNFNPDFTQAGNYSLTLYASDNIDTVSFMFTIEVADCDVQLQTHATIVPSMLYAYFLHAIEPMTGTIYFGDFTNGEPVTDVDLSTILINGTITPTTASVEPSYTGFTGEVIKLEFDMNDFLNMYMPFFDTTIQQYTIDGSFHPTRSLFSVTGDVRLRGHLSGDFNLDGVVDIADLVATVNYFFNEGEPPQYILSIDMNHDGSIDIVDLQMIVYYLFD